jgi:hypothetical protein
MTDINTPKRMTGALLSGVLYLDEQGRVQDVHWCMTADGDDAPQDIQPVIRTDTLDTAAETLAGMLAELADRFAQAAGESDHRKVFEYLQSLEAEGERSLLTGFQFWPPATSWDWIYEDLSSGYLPAIIAFCLAGFLEEFLPEDAGLAELDVHAAAPALALSLAPYLQLDQSGWDDCTQVSRFPLKALLACYFDYTDNIFLGRPRVTKRSPSLSTGRTPLGLWKITGRPSRFGRRAPRKKN